MNVQLQGGGAVALGALLGEGGQGSVYRASIDGVNVAVKLYHAHTATPAQRDAIRRLVDRGSPSPTFLWPTRMIEGDGRFGYTMPLREARFASAEALVTRRVQPSLRTLVTASCRLVEAFQALHAAGWCYRDVSFGNVAIDPTTGDVCVLDVDNVDVPGAPNVGVLGTPRFMAPEVVTGREPPSDDTDRFSLAVLLFYVLYNAHPLDGAVEANTRCFDEPAMRRLYGEAPVYVFDPADASNRPVPGIHDNALIYHAIWPSDLRRLFERSFTEGLRDPRRRVRETEWKRGLHAVLDRFGACTCGAAVVFDDAPRPCWRCKKAVPTPLVLAGDAGRLWLAPGATLRPHLVGQATGVDALGEVVAHPTDPARLGLRNLTTAPWLRIGADQARAEVPPGKAAALERGAVLHIDGCALRVG